MADWIPKEYYTIALDGIPVQRIAGFLRDTLGLCEKQLLHSGFYSEQTGDVPYTDALDLQAFFAARNRASFHLKTVRFDRAYRGGSCLVYPTAARRSSNATLSRQILIRKSCRIRKRG